VDPHSKKIRGIFEKINQKLENIRKVDPNLLTVKHIEALVGVAEKEGLHLDENANLTTDNTELKEEFNVSKSIATIDPKQAQII
jgi:hypothetical protein